MLAKYRGLIGISAKALFIVTLVGVTCTISKDGYSVFGAIGKFKDYQQAYKVNADNKAALEANTRAFKHLYDVIEKLKNVGKLSAEDKNNFLGFIGTDLKSVNLTVNEIKFINIKGYLSANKTYAYNDVIYSVMTSDLSSTDNNSTTSTTTQNSTGTPAVNKAPQNSTVTTGQANQQNKQVVANSQPNKQVVPSNAGAANLIQQPTSAGAANVNPAQAQAQSKLNNNTVVNNQNQINNQNQNQINNQVNTGQQAEPNSIDKLAELDGSNIGNIAASDANGILIDISGSGTDLTNFIFNLEKIHFKYFNIVLNNNKDTSHLTIIVDLR